MICGNEVRFTEGVFEIDDEKELAGMRLLPIKGLATHPGGKSRHTPGRDRVIPLGGIAPCP